MTTTDPQDAPVKPRLFLPSWISALLLWAAFFPLNLGPLAFVALVPFLALVRAEGVGRWRRYGAAFAGGVLFFGLAFNWVRVAHPMMALFAWPGVTLYCASYWPLALFLLRRLDNARILPAVLEWPRDGGRRRPPFALTLPVAWVLLEYVRAHFPTGFPFLAHVGAFQMVGVGWYALGYTQHQFLPLMQIADLGGVYLVSVVVAAANGAAYEWALRFGPFRWLIRADRSWIPTQFTREFAVTALTACVAGPLLLYGGFRLMHPPFPPGPFVALLQGNLSQDEKILRAELARGEATPLEREYFPLAAGAASGRERRPDLTVWPETTFPDNWIEIAPGVDPDSVHPNVARNADVSAKNFAYLAGKLWKGNTLFGLNAVEAEGDDKFRKYNSALFVRGDGVVGGRYDKMHLVPFGEYVPLRDWFPWLRRLTPYDHDYSCTPGDALPRLEMRAADGTVYRFGVLICYEDSDGDLARQYNPLAGRGPGADFLVNISNDGWFDGTEEHEQHLAISRFRAVEARRALVRAVNMGISGVIDGDGRVVALPRIGAWSVSKKVTAIVKEFVPIDGRDSPYAMAGDWLMALFAGIVAVGAVWRRG